MQFRKIKTQIRESIFQTVLSKIDDIDELDEIIEDSLLKYFDISLLDLQDCNTQIEYFEHYVYCYMDPRHSGMTINEIVFDSLPFYIGKGKNNRIDNIFRNSDVAARIVEIRASGKNYIAKKIKIGLPESSALKLESFLIKELGRIDLGTGILLNRANGSKPENVKIKNNIKSLLPPNKSTFNVKNVVKDNLLSVLNRTKNFEFAAKELGVSPRTIYRQFKIFNIEKKNGIYVSSDVTV